MYNPFSTKKEFEIINEAFLAEGPIEKNPQAAEAFNRIANKVLIRTAIVTGVIIGGVVAASVVLSKLDIEDETEEDEENDN